MILSVGPSQEQEQFLASYNSRSVTRCTMQSSTMRREDGRGGGGGYYSLSNSFHTSRIGINHINTGADHIR